MTQDEEIISNISYTSNDFRSIYPELLDTAKKLTNKWDPSLSNESDPGNILIKEAAIVGDKVNYHIDKNVLECFPLSATQQSSARQIYDLVGYNMHWYRSAEGIVTFKLIKRPDVIDSDLSYIQVKAGTILSDTTGEYVYTLLEPTDRMTSINAVYQAPAIQGTITQYEINGEFDITVNNLDKNLRLYFPQNIIAENGIFVFNKGYTPEISGFNNKSMEDNTWALVDNLTKYPAKSKVFKFGLDFNSDNCYIEFPEDISDIIGDGLNIYYTTTLGQNGNLKKGILNKFLNDYTQAIDDNSYVENVNKYIAVDNLPTQGGTDPESLQEAYKNYKKLIGTYDTLVTRRDYENAIYNLENSLGSGSLVSNDIVTDRTTDMNYSQRVIQTNLATDYTKNYVYRKDNEDIMKPYDICLYLLKAPESMLSVDNYNTSFEPDLDGTTKVIIEDDLDELKSVQHNFYYIPEINTDIQAKDLYFNIRNLTRLTGTLTTYYKVSQAEAIEIENNVTKTLTNTYNARAIDFGNSLDFDDLVATIKNADDRIRNVSINTPTYEPTMIFADGSSQSLYVAGENTISTDPLYFQNINNETLAKMILAGKVQLFKFQDDFQFDFGQTNGKTFSNLETIYTTNPIRINGIENKNDTSTQTPLNQNDIVQIIIPNLVATETYQATVSFAANFEFGTSAYKLKDDNKIKFIFIDPNTSAKKVKVYEAGTIIQGVGITYDNQAMITYWNSVAANWDSTDTSHTKLLNAGQSIEILEQSSITLSQNTPYYVISDRIENNLYKITLTANTPYILGQNEYLLYTNSTLDALVILGSGTTLKSSSGEELSSEVITLEEITTTDIDDAKSKWNKLEHTLKAEENTVLNLTEGDKVAFKKKDGATVNYIDCSNNLQSDDSSIAGFYYILKDENEIKELSGAENSSTIIYYKSNMVLQGNMIVPQELQGVQTIKTAENGEIIASAESGKNNFVLYSYPVNLSGGNSVNVQVLNESTGKYENELNIYSYQKNNVTSPNNIERKNGVITIKATDFVDKLNYTFIKTDDGFGDNDYLIPVSFILPNGTKAVLKVTNATIGDFLDIVDGTSATDTYEINKTSNKVISIATSTNTDDINISIGYECTINNNDIELTYGDTTITLGYNEENEITYNGNTYSYIDDDEHVYYGLYIREDNNDVKGQIKVDTDNNIIAIKDKDVFGDLTTTMSGISATFGYIEQITGLNSEEIDSENIAGNHYEFKIENNYGLVLSQVKNILNKIDNQAEYDWTYHVPSANKVLQPLSGESYFNTNHVYNKCTIAKIEFEESSIKVNPSSIK